MKKIIIQCCAKKNGDEWSVSGLNGLRVKFIAHPELCKRSGLVIFCKPDDRLPNESTTWRQYLESYNKNGTNPDYLCRAGDLYQPNIYRQLVDKYGWENTYILSAGWGMVRSDYLLPYYDITFSKKADKCKQRSRTDIYNDFNHLINNEIRENKDSIYFFGGMDYLNLFYTLTQNILVRKVVYYLADNITRRSNYEYIKYETKIITNWHYACAQDFLRGKINQ